MAKVFFPAKMAYMRDFFKNNTDFIYDDLIEHKTVAEYRLNYIKKIAKKVQLSLLEGFDKTGGSSEKLEKLGQALNEKINSLDYSNLEVVKESLTGTFLGLMIVLGLSQKIHGEDYWNKQKDWQDFNEWLASMNENIYELDEEVKKILNSSIKA